jgi:hypothetical protein
MTRPFGPPDHYFEPDEDDGDDAAELRAFARSILDLISEELASLATLDEDDREQAAKDLVSLSDKLARYPFDRADWGAWDVVNTLRVALLRGDVLDLGPTDNLRATLEEAAREPEFSPDFEPAWEE